MKNPPALSRVGRVRAGEEGQSGEQLAGSFQLSNLRRLGTAAANRSATSP